jgi:hypothetical protein
MLHVPGRFTGRMHIEASMQKPKKRKRVTRTAVAVEPLAHTIMNTARLLSCGRTLVYDEINRGNLDLVKVGGASRVTTESIHRLLAEKRVMP